jgi:dimethylhistidine N-methyltransferase
MTPASRVSMRPPADDVSTQQFAEDVAFSLSQSPRQLPTRYLYDALGSALFDAICRLPWYGLTRAELGLLHQHGDAILEASAPLTDLVELGPGNGEKLMTLLRARPGSSPSLRVHLVDVSRDALAIASGLLAALPAVAIVTHQTTYEAGLADVSREQSGHGRTLALFLGSNLGNFHPPDANALLRQMADALQPRDLFLLGVDLVKPEANMVAAYDDPLGVTAAFNRNLLVRMNRELGADFDVAAFRHRAVWNASASRIESYLVSLRAQHVRVPAAELELSLAEGDAIWTESSYKFTVDGVFEQLAQAGFSRRHAWVDEEARFALTLAERATA